MKTNYFKIVMPIVAVLLAIGASFVSHASEKSEKKVSAGIFGYISPLTIPQINGCQISTPCSTIFQPSVCTATYQGQAYQAFFRQNASDTACPIVLYRWPE